MVNGVSQVEGASYYFDPEGTDEDNAEGMLNFLLNVRPKNQGCSKVRETGRTQFLECKCLNNIMKAVDAANQEEKEKWKILFTQFARALKPIALEIPKVQRGVEPPPVPVYLLIRFMDEFRHVFQRTTFNSVKAYVISSPIGALLMDFNGIACLPSAVPGLPHDV
jgi:hypothetical protein